MNGYITLAALRQCQRASKVISPFIIFAFFDVSFRRIDLKINTRLGAWLVQVGLSARLC